MNDLSLGLIFLVLGIFGVILKTSYNSLPARELKRRAQGHDPRYEKLYRAVAYGPSLSILLWLYTGLTTAASFVLFARALPIWASLLVIALLLWIAFSVIPTTRVSRIGLLLTRLVTPFIAWLLNYIHPLLARAERIGKRYAHHQHTGLFDHQDMVSLIKRQKAQADSRITKEELDLVERGLKFSERKVSDVLTPRKKVKSVLASDTVGPILINDLHESKQSYVLVKQSPKGPVLGTLAFKDLDISSQGKVEDHMDRALYYLNEDDSLSEALQAFFQTDHSMFVVLNSFEEYVGIVSVESVLRKLVGEATNSDFDNYADPAAVANRHQKPQAPDEADKASVKTDDEVVE